MNTDTRARARTRTHAHTHTRTHAHTHAHRLIFVVVFFFFFFFFSFFFFFFFLFQVVYGEKRGKGGVEFKGHAEILKPSVQELSDLESRAQSSFLHLQYDSQPWRT